MADDRKVIRIRWVSEVQNAAGRRALLVLTYPAFLAWLIVASIFKAALVAIAFAIAAPLWNILRGGRILTYSARMRWNKAKPRGADDWVVHAVDSYVDLIDGA